MICDTFDRVPTDREEVSSVEPQKSGACERAFCWIDAPAMNNGYVFTMLLTWINVISKYLHLPSIFPIKCVGGPSAFMRAWLPRYVNQHSATYIVLISAYEFVDANG